MKNKNQNSVPSSGKPIYKKWWFWLIVLVIIGSVFGGGSKDDKETTAKTTDKTEETQTTKEDSADEEKEDTLDGEPVEVEKETDPSGFTDDDHIYMMTITQQILDQYLTKYKTPWGDYDWKFVKFDDNGAVMTSTEITLKDSSFKQPVYCIFDYDTSEDPDHPKFIEHVTIVGDSVLYDDGYADEFFNNLAEMENYANNE